MPTTANKGYSTPAFNSNVGTWGTTDLNGNFTIQDLNLGGVTSVALSNVDVTLTGTQAQNLTVALTGTLLTTVTVFTPCIGFFFIVNNTTGNFPVNLQANFGAGNVGSAIIVPQGMRLFLVSDTTNGVQYAASPASETLVGEIKAYAGSSAPTGWLLCYGQAISRTIYASLFAVISTSYGPGDGSLTFNLPDLRGRTIAGFDNMGGSDAGRLDWANTINTSGGEQYHTLITAEMPSHTHTNSGHSHTVPISNPNSNYSIIAGSAFVGQAIINSGTMATSTTSITIQSTGGGGQHNNMPPTLLCNWLIRAF